MVIITSRRHGLQAVETGTALSNIVEGHKGNKKDPIPWVYGMDCHTGSYYSYGGVVYRAAENMLPCVWYPDSGIWQWEVANE